MNTRNSTGATGVYRDSRCDRWIAKIMNQRRVFNLGRYQVFEFSVMIHQRTERDLRGFINAAQGYYD
jgi:hypothetical protein